MKIRNGFVSNSSSSSFVLVGVKLTKREQEIFATNYDDELYPPEDLSVDDWENPKYIGLKRSISDEDYSTHVLMNLGQAEIDELKTKIKDYVGHDVQDLIVIFGKEMS